MKRARCVDGFQDINHVPRPDAKRIQSFHKIA